MRYFLALAFLLSASFAEAATVTITFGNKSRTWTITAQNAQRLANWASSAYATIPNPQAGQEGQSATIPNPEPVLSAIDALWEGIKANVRRHELEASKAAVTEPGEIN